MTFLIQRCSICHTHIPAEFTFVPATNPCNCLSHIKEGIHLPSYDTLERRIEELEKTIKEKDKIIETLTRRIHPLGVFRF